MREERKKREGDRTSEDVNGCPEATAMGSRKQAKEAGELAIGWRECTGVCTRVGGN